MTKRGTPEATVQLLAAESAAHLDHLVERVVPLLIAAEPAGFFSEAGTADLRDAAADGLRAVLSVLSGGPLEPQLAVPALAGRRQVQQGLPLEGVLRAYRIAGQAVWEHFVAQARSGPAHIGEALLDGASEVWRVIDLFSTAAGEAYRAEDGVLRTRDHRMRASVLAALLAGDGSDPLFVRDAGRALGLDGAAGYACVVALSDPASVSALDMSEDALDAFGVSSVWLSRPGGEVGLVSLLKVRPPRLLELLADRAKGRVGVSPQFDDLAVLPRAERLADLAARLPGPGSLARTVTADLVAALVVDSPLIAELIADATVGALLRAAKADGPEMLSTVRAFVESDARLDEAAERSFLHRNTVRYRLDKVERLTGVSLRSHSGQLMWRLGLLTQDVRR